MKRFIGLVLVAGTAVTLALPPAHAAPPPVPIPASAGAEAAAQGAQAVGHAQQ